MPIPLMLAAAGIGAIGDLLSGVSANSAAHQKAKALEAGGRQALSEAGVAAQLALDEGDQAQGRAAVLAAASGGGITGSAVDVLGQLGRKAAFNAQSAVYRGEMEARNADAEAEATRQEGRMKLVTGMFKAGGTVLGGIGLARANRAASLSSAGRTIKLSGAPLKDVYSGQY